LRRRYAVSIAFYVRRFSIVESAVRFICVLATLACPPMRRLL